MYTTKWCILFILINWMHTSGTTTKFLTCRVENVNFGNTHAHKKNTTLCILFILINWMHTSGTTTKSLTYREENVHLGNTLAYTKKTTLAVLQLHYANVHVYSGTPLNGHPWIADTCSITATNRSLDWISVHPVHYKPLNSGHPYTPYEGCFHCPTYVNVILINLTKADTQYSGYVNM